LVMSHWVTRGSVMTVARVAMTVLGIAD
jgi:hypothetical protein